jgi:5-hydroxyisourate hydrolase-like protein (transthyretin family)
MEIYGMKIDQTQQRPHITVTCQITDTLGNLLDQKTLQEKALVFDGSKLIISMLWPENTFLAGKYRLKMNIEDQISQQTISTEASFQILGS